MRVSFSDALGFRKLAAIAADTRRVLALGCALAAATALGFGFAAGLLALLAVQVLHAALSAPVVPLSADKGKRGLAGVGAKQRIGRSVSMPSRKAVHLEPLDPKVVKMLDLQSNILERLRAKLDIDKIPYLVAHSLCEHNRERRHENFVLGCVTVEA